MLDGWCHRCWRHLGCFDENSQTNHLQEQYRVPLAKSGAMTVIGIENRNWLNLLKGSDSLRSSALWVEETKVSEMEGFKRKEWEKN